MPQEPPDTIVQRALRFSWAILQPFVGEPDHLPHGDSDRMLRWNNAVTQCDIVLTANGDAVLQYINHRELALVPAQSQSDVRPRVTEEQAEALARRYVMAAFSPSGDWRWEPLVDSRHAEGRSWHFVTRRFVDGYPSYAEYVDGTISAITGGLQSLHATEPASYLPPNARLVSPQAAQSVAQRAWREAGGPAATIGSAPTDRLGWRPVSRNSRLCRLSYAFFFRTESSGGRLSVVAAIVDAQSGELWSQSALAGGLPGSRRASRCPRARLLEELAQDARRAPLLRAVAGGRLLRTDAPGSGAAFSDGALALRWDARRRALSWRQTDRAWTTVALAPDEAGTLTEWLRSQSVLKASAER